MANPSDLYLKEMFHKFSYHANWLPNANLSLGDVGIMNGMYFKRITSLQKQGIEFEVRKGALPVDFYHQSKSGLKMHGKASGELAPGTSLPLVDAGGVIEFNEAGAFVFSAAHCIEDEIEDRKQLGDDIKTRYENKTWEFEWVVVDSIVRAGLVSILVSNSQDAKLELSAKAPLTKAVDLANLDAKIKVTAISGDVTNYIAKKGLFPLYKLSRLKTSLKHLLLGGESILFGGPVAAPADEEWLEPVGIDL